MGWFPVRALATHIVTAKELIMKVFLMGEGNKMQASRLGCYSMLMVLAWTLRCLTVFCYQS